MPLVSVLRRQSWADLCECEANMVYIVSSRPPTVTLFKERKKKRRKQERRGRRKRGEMEGREGRREGGKGRESGGSYTAFGYTSKAAHIPGLLRQCTYMGHRHPCSQNTQTHEKGRFFGVCSASALPLLLTSLGKAFHILH